MSTRRRSSGRRRAAVVVTAMGLTLLAALVAGAVAVVRTLFGPSSESACTVKVPGRASYVLDPDQAQNASIIAAVAEGRGLPDHAVTVALATAMQESKLHDVDHGDRDSLGLFQQRPSQGWGSPAQIMDPAYAAGAFYDRLVKVPGWQALSVTQVAQTVQLSADPSAYAGWEAEARAAARALTGEVPGGLACRLAGFDGVAPVTGALADAARSEFSAPVIGTPLAGRRGWAVASWAVAHAFRYHLAWVRYSGLAWDARSGSWRPGPDTAGAVLVDT